MKNLSPSIDVIEQTQFGNLGKAALCGFQRQLVFVHLGDGFGVVQVLDVGHGAFQAQGDFVQHIVL